MFMNGDVTVCSQNLYLQPNVITGAFEIEMNVDAFS